MSLADGNDPVDPVLAITKYPYSPHERAFARFSVKGKNAIGLYRSLSCILCSRDMPYSMVEDFLSFQISKAKTSLPSYRRFE